MLAQRLVRTLCSACKVDAAPAGAELQLLADLGLPATQHVTTAPGCDQCGRTGFRGRTGVYELIVVDDAMRRLIHERAPEHALRAAALANGMTPLRRDGARWIAAGATSLAELVRVTREA